MKTVEVLFVFTLKLLTIQCIFRNSYIVGNLEKALKMGIFIKIRPFFNSLFLLFQLRFRWLIFTALFEKQYRELQHPAASFSFKKH